MNLQKTSLTGLALAVLAAAPAMAQQPAMPANPTMACTATPAQLAANKKVVMSFFDPTVDRVALADPSYKQHNPAFKKRAEDNHVTDYEEYKAAFGAGRQGGGRGRGAGNGPAPPQGNQLEVVTAECDIVTVIHKNYRQDPTADPGKFYEVFTFDSFRVKDGKLVEHWDGAVINPPAPAGGPGR
jgi:predicted SnoaL-like aldol condensation-catalyzing enzyme